MPSIQFLPRELVEQISGMLELQDLAHLGGTCSSLRAFAAPRLFETVVFTDNARAADSACLAAGRYSAFVRHLKLIVTFQGCTDPECDCLESTSEACFAVANPDIGGIPPSAEVLLGGGALPALKSIIVEFPARYKHAGMLFGDWWDEIDPRLVPMGDNFAIVVRAVTMALTRNASISSMSLLNYPPISPLDGASPDYNDAWKELLGRLADFRLSLFGAFYPLHQPMGYGTEEMLASDDYRASLQHLESFFFAHLRSVRRLAICCSKHAPLGGAERGNTNPRTRMSIALALDPAAMPFLEHLELNNMFLGPELGDFLVGLGADRPLSLCLDNLKPDDHSSLLPGYTWKEFFDRLVDSRVSIWRFRLAPTEVPVRSSPAHEIMARDPSRRAFPYAWMQLEESCLQDDMVRNARSVVEGAD
ncbi:hypothetical protein GGTG_05136 [Gaeumannomyces tritici R3-111a-1]|uniref:F-box domain-containing protein n=1 Tax=Gaeumannomyces tritici (strain R3-111a-1) TaxID=644352 RepID=J3NV27_GAET3|nr:hypothetical protein GGTG_05136 [Gaeumannomyces tritici R3-111a-1]EJT75199.1 hypothetical protein GGTG_05136 [Gaeumannomyces tritici R3-111a-1]